MYTDIDLTDKFDYDGELCLELYKGLDDGGNMDDFVTYLKRLVVMRIRKSYLKRTARDVCEDLVQAVLLELWQLAQKRKLPTESAALYHGFINTVIRRRVAKTFSTMYDDAPKAMEAHDFILETSHRLQYGDEEELRIFRQDLPETLQKRVLDLSWPAEDRPAVEYILETLLVYKEDVREAWLKRHYQIRDPKFLVDSVLIRLRAELYELRKEVKYRTSAERHEILHDGLEATLTA